MINRYGIYGINKKDEFVYVTCLDYNIVHCVEMCKENGIELHKIEHINFETEDLPVGIEKIERVQIYV